MVLQIEDIVMQKSSEYAYSVFMAVYVTVIMQ